MQDEYTQSIWKRDRDQQEKVTYINIVVLAVIVLLAWGFVVLQIVDTMN